MSADILVLIAIVVFIFLGWWAALVNLTTLATIAFLVAFGLVIVGVYLAGRTSSSRRRR